MISSSSELWIKKTDKSKWDWQQPPMASISPPPATNSFPNLHHRRQPPSHLHSVRRRVLQTKPKTITTGDHRSRQALRIINAAASASGGLGRIPLSDVVVKWRRKVYLGRKWNPMNVATAGVVATMHLLCLFAPFTFNPAALTVAIGLYVITGLLGITLSFHRNLSHKSFKLPKWLEYTFAYCGVQALQGNPIDWVSTHRYHHQYCDSDRDPHSPIEGFWFSHMNWLFDTDKITKRCGEPNNVGDMEKQAFYRFLRSSYVVHPVALALILHALGGFPFIVWGMERHGLTVGTGRWHGQSAMKDEQQQPAAPQQGSSTAGGRRQRQQHRRSSLLL